MGLDVRQIMNLEQIPLQEEIFKSKGIVTRTSVTSFLYHNIKAIIAQATFVITILKPIRYALISWRDEQIMK
jgi:hypothetical protein